VLAGTGISVGAGSVVVLVVVVGVVDVVVVLVLVVVAVVVVVVVVAGSSTTPIVVGGSATGATLLKLSPLEPEQAATRIAATRVAALYRIERRSIVARTAASPALPSPYLCDSRQSTIADAAVGQAHLNG